MNTLSEIARYVDACLRIGEIADYPEAHNGLQLENGGSVTRIGAAVDACGYTVHAAAERGIDLLLVHHGLFWGGVHPMTGSRYRLWKRALDSGLAIYSAHLPLDAHPELGNNALLAVALGMEQTEPFMPYKGTALGVRARLDVSRATLVQRLERAVGGSVRVCPGGPDDLVGEVGVVTGGAGSEVRAAAAAGINTFVTGEGPHWTYPLAEELGVNILYGGHYATETFGVKALAAHLAERYALPWEFIDHPTGL